MLGHKQWKQWITCVKSKEEEEKTKDQGLAAELSGRAHA
jgi:hypothetical protein